MSQYNSQYTGNEIDKGVKIALESLTINGHFVIPSTSDNPVDLNQVTTPGAYTIEYFTNGYVETEAISPIMFFVYEIDLDITQRYLSTVGWAYRKKDHTSGTWTNWKVQSYESPATVISATTGSSTAYEVTTNKDYDTYETGDSIIIIPHITSTTQTPTLNVNSLGAIPLKYVSYEGDTPISDGLYAGWIEKGMPIKATYYDGTFLVQRLTSAEFSHIDIDNVDGVDAAWALIKGKHYYLKSHATQVDFEGSTLDQHIDGIRNQMNELSNQLQQKVNPIFGIMPNITPANSSMYEIAYGNNVFVFTTSVGITTMATYDKSFVNCTLPVSGKTWISVVCGCGRFVAISSDCTIIYSDDGYNWKSSLLNSLSLTPNKLVYGDGMFLLFPTAGTSAYYMYSTDGGVEWHSAPLSTNMKAATIAAICYGEGKFVAIGTSSSTIFTSTDGLHWTESTISLSTTWKSMIYANGMFVAISSTSKVYAYSKDAITWTVINTPEAESWVEISYGYGIYMVTTGTKKIFYSTNLTDWTTVTVAYDNVWNDISYGSGLFIVTESTTNGRNALVYDTSNSKMHHSLMTITDNLAMLLEQVQTIGNQIIDDSTAERYRFGINNGRPYIYTE